MVFGPLGATPASDSEGTTVTVACLCQSALLLPLDSAQPTVDSAVIPPISSPSQAPPGRH